MSYIMITKQIIKHNTVKSQKYKLSSVQTLRNTNCHQYKLSEIQTVISTASQKYKLSSVQTLRNTNCYQYKLSEIQTVISTNQLHHLQKNVILQTLDKFDGERQGCLNF